LLSQKSIAYEFIGSLALNNHPETLITFELAFNEDDGVISGYSLTDFLGAHETKNKILGTYDRKSKTITFEEKEIIYTKSDFNPDSFCNIHFEGAIKLRDKVSKLTGDFESYYPNGNSCLKGGLNLINKFKIDNLIAKIDERIQKSKKVDEQTKREVNVRKLLADMKINKLSSNENLTLFTASDSIEINFWDNGKEDGDKINLFHNGKLILMNYEVMNAKKYLSLKLVTGKNEFKLVALNEGELSPNTPKIELIDENRVFEMQGDLKIKEYSIITVIKKL